MAELQGGSAGGRPNEGSTPASSSGPSPRPRSRSRRIVPRAALTNGRYDRKPVVATRFVRACSKGHVDDVDWCRFVHGPDDPCRRALWFERADIALEPAWFPAVENRGEGILLQLRAEAIKGWLARAPVKRRLDELVSGHDTRAARRKSERPFPGGPCVLLHTPAHLLVQSLSMRCGYPAASVRERIYVDDPGERYALLLYTASPDAEGALGGLVQEARRIEDHVRHALRSVALCSNDPVCAEHVPGHSMEERWLHGAACHGCTLIAETSCEMRNEYLDRALVAPALDAAGAAFFAAP